MIWRQWSMTVLEWLVFLFVMGVGLWAWVGLLAGCGTESRQSAQAVAVTPASLATPTPLPDCVPPLTPSPGHRVETRTYRVCVSPGATQQVTVTTDTGPDAADWLPADVPCVDGGGDQEVCR
jgi:hypothetical protein